MIVLHFRSWHIIELVNCTDGLIDATFSPQRYPGELKTITLFAALLVPLIITAGSVIQLFEFIIGNLVRFDS